MTDGSSQHLAPTRRLAILIVEDDFALAENLSEILRGFGFDVTTAASAEHALAYLEQHVADCVLTDLKLPGQGGIELIEELRRRRLTVPAIVMSGFVDPPILDRASALGVLDVQSKPVNLARLQDVLSQLAS